MLFSILENPLRIVAAITFAVSFMLFPRAADAGAADDAVTLLQMRCWTCHGAERHRADLRLDSLEGIQSGGKSNRPAALAGDASASLLFEKITSTDPKKRMPAAGPPLTTEEVAVLVAWINEGMTWPAYLPPPSSTHWAFVAPTKAPLPETKFDDRSDNPVDRFLFARLEQEGLQPAPLADRYTLIRRASLELTGLPPTPEETIAFVEDSRPDAYDRLLDRLMASPHYGERQARRWLDAARYADTNGYEKDRPRTIWPWRDWVINAYNHNMPYDEFVTEQLAGDLLPNATESQRVATGFHRNTMFNEEGGIDAAEDWYKRTLDRTNSTGTIFLGLTVSCAQCHNHKYDPISQREYFRMFSFFNDAQEATLPLDDATVDAARQSIQRKIDGLADWIVWLAKRDSTVQSEMETWIESAASDAGRWIPVSPDRAVSEKDATLKVLDDASVLATGDIPNDDTYTLDFAQVSGSVTAMRLEVLPHESLPGGGPGRGTILAEGDFLLTGLEAILVSESGDEIPIPIAAASHDYAAKDRSADQALDGKSDTGWSVKGATGKSHRAVFTFTDALPAGKHRVRIVLHHDYIHQHTLGRFRVSWTTDTPPKIAANVPAEIETILAAGDAACSQEDRDWLARYYALDVAPQLESWRKKRAELRKSMPKYTTTLVMTERTPHRETHLHTRGDFLRPRRKVDPDVPKILPPLPDRTKRDRLTLARWIMDRDNPLTARVAVNRLWQQVFGTGLVATPEDFGTQGSRPSHPELLDWLAVEFVESGWNMKALHRRLVSSAAFRRDSRVAPELLNRDPGNHLLARGSRFRLQAEVIRDLTLSAAGLLNPAIGGPSVYPPQPEGVTSLGYQNAAWPTSTGPDRYRRGLYTYMRRTTPYAGFTVFDGPTAEQACVRRQRSNTPLQALTLLNDQVTVEAAQSLARRVMHASDDMDTRIDTLYLLCLSRYPDTTEREEISAFYAHTLKQIQDEPDQARQVAGPAGLLEGSDVQTVAAWTAVSRVVLNLDETITQR
jgi:mono/diheme cytochrome c family protein